MSKQNVQFLMEQFKRVKLNPSMEPYLQNEGNIEVWHISFLGPQNTPFEKGIYHCEFDLHEYPELPPAIRMLNDTGSYETNVNICIEGISAYHPELWTPNTNIDAIIDALRGYMDERSDRNGIGFIKNLNFSQIEKYCVFSKQFVCTCGADHKRIELHYE